METFAYGMLRKVKLLRHNGKCGLIVTINRKMHQDHPCAPRLCDRGAFQSWLWLDRVLCIGRTHVSWQGITALLTILNTIVEVEYGIRVLDNASKRLQKAMMPSGTLVSVWFIFYVSQIRPPANTSSFPRTRSISCQQLTMVLSGSGTIKARAAWRPTLDTSITNTASQHASAWRVENGSFRVVRIIRSISGICKLEKLSKF